MKAPKILSFREKLIEAVLYGKQVGKTHTDGSRLRKGNTFMGTPGTKFLLDENGEVIKFFEKKRLSKDTFEVVQGKPITDSHLDEHHITRTIYSTEPGNRYIIEDQYVGRYFNGRDGENVGWGLSRGGVKTTHTELKG